MIVFLKRFLEFVLAMQIAMCFAVVLDIPIARQIIGFVFLSFIPGMVFLRIVKLNRLSIMETILFSVGFSIALLMFVGLLMNELYPLIGILKPLSIHPLLITISIFVLTLCAISYRFGEKNFSIPCTIISNRNLLSSRSTALLLVCLPFLSILGALLVNHLILLLLVVLISILVILGALSERIPADLYPLAILVIAIALLFHESLTSPHLYGVDIHFEYYVFNLVKNDSLWKNVSLPTLQLSTFNAMLSITILPTLYSNLLNMPGVWLFKIIYPLIFSLVPLGLYQIYQKQMGKRTAFLSTFFFMSFSFFHREHLMIVRQMIGELFFVLMILLLLDKKIDSFRKNVLFTVFGMGLVVSHYAVSYLYMFFISFIWLISILTSTKKIRVTATTITLFFTIAFSWYIYASASSIFEAAVSWGNHVLTTFSTDLFNPLSRESAVLIGIGMGGPAESVGHEIGRLIHYVTELFIVIGVIDTLWKRKKSRYDQEYILLSVASMLLLLMNIVIPYFTAIGMTRIYYLSSAILAPFCIIGGEKALRYILSVFGKVSRANVKTPVLTVLMLYFLINIGFIYEITGDPAPSSFALSMYRMDRVKFYNDKYSSDYEICGARWLARVRDPSTTIYADLIAKDRVLASYGMIPQQDILVLFNNTERIYKGYIYLRSVNTIDGKMVYRYIPEKGYEMFDISEISYLFDHMNKIYSNGESDIYKDWNQG